MVQQNDIQPYVSVSEEIIEHDLLFDQSVSFSTVFDMNLITDMKTVENCIVNFQFTT